MVSCKPFPASGLVPPRMARTRDLDRSTAEVLRRWADESPYSKRALAAAAGLAEGTIRKMLGGEEGPASGESMTLDNVDAVLARLGRSWDELMDEAGSRAVSGAGKRLRSLEAQRETLLNLLGQSRGDDAPPVAGQERPLPGPKIDRLGEAAARRQTLKKTGAPASESRERDSRRSGDRRRARTKGTP